MADYELANLLIEQDNEYLREQWFNIIHNHIIYINAKEIKRVLLEELSNDWELYFMYLRHKNEVINKVIKLLSDDLRRNGVRYVSKYIIPSLFKKMLKEYNAWEYKKKNRHRIYFIRKRQKLMAELKILYIK